VILKLFTFGFAVATIGLVCFFFPGWYVWQMADFDCVGTYWECHRRVIPEVIKFQGIPLLGWLAYAWLLRRAWKNK